MGSVGIVFLPGHGPASVRAPLPANEYCTVRPLIAPVPQRVLSHLTMRMAGDVVE
jgi:hypothetical protein